MLITSFKRLIAVILLCNVVSVACAQQDHFIYLQTENTQPFYVKVNSKLISSSTMGYLIIPKLKDGNYTLNIGFPKNEFPEESFSLSVNNKNEGYLLKNFGDKGWGLFDMQSYGVVMSDRSTKKETVSQNIESDPFSKMLATVVKDSSILQKNGPVKLLPVKVDSSNITVSNTASPDTVARKETSVKVDSSNLTAPNNVKPSVATPKAEIQSSLIVPAKKLLSKKNADGMEMIYVDSDVSKSDTVRIFIPVDKEPMVESGKVSNSSQTKNAAEPVQQTDSAITIVEKKTSVSDNNKEKNAAAPVFIDDINSVKITDTATRKSEYFKRPDESQQDSLSENKTVNGIVDNKRANDSGKDEIVVLPKVVQSSTINSDCKAFADNDDFLRLRKKMASGSSEDAMIKLAKKAFRSKCFSTEQIKNLSLLFLTNEGKYRFFDEAYAFTSDSDKYFTLQSQLTDSYYINRFKAMIHK